MRRPTHTILRSTGRTLRVSVALAYAALFVFAGVAEAHAIDRAEVIARAQRWVDLEVPYSQSLYFEGYRQDCSGFVSMAWQLTWPTGAAKSLATDTLPQACTPITMDDLAPGDAIIRPKTATTWGHAVIFGGWTNAERTHYWAFEQSNSAGGARLRETPYPYWSVPGEGFAPYRFTGIAEGPTGALIEPIAGSSRYATAAQASRRAFPDPDAVDTVVIATGQSWPDALGGAALAGAVRGPVLLTMRTTLPVEVRTEIARLSPSRAIVLGGDAAVSDEVLSELMDAGVGHVERIAGGDRYETSVAVARATMTEATVTPDPFDRYAYIATGNDFPDALAASAIAAHRARPVLLVRSSSVPTVTADALAEFAMHGVYIVGGESAVSAAVESEFATSVPMVSRLAGATRYETALVVAEHSVAEGLSRSGAGLATGRSFADALAGGAAQGLSAPASVLYLTSPSRLPDPVRAEIWTHRLQIGSVRVYGGTVAVSEPVRMQTIAALQGW